MKIGLYITAALFLVSTSTWAEVNITGSYSLHEVKKLDNTYDTVPEGSDRIVSVKADVDALGALMCERDLAEDEGVFAVIPCPVATIEAAGGIQLTVLNSAGGEVCPRLDVDISNIVMAQEDGNPLGRVTKISGVAELALGGQGQQSDVDWVAHISVKTKVVDLQGVNLNCAKDVSSKTGTGTINGNPISKIKLKIGKVLGGTVIVPNT